MRVRLVLVLLLVLGLVPACGDDGGSTEVASAEPVRSDADRVEPPADAPVDELVRGMADFAFDFQRLMPADDNLVFSPTSIATAFAMADGAADGPTAATIEEVFGFPAAPGVHEAMNALLRQLDVDEEELTVSIANSSWAQQGRQISTDYLDLLATQYGAGIETVDLQGDNEGSRQTINRWVAEETRDRIPDLLPPGFINPLTVYVLVNAVYFKGDWEQPFGQYPTEPAPFTRRDGTRVDVDMMHNAELGARYLHEEGLDVVELPYAGDFSMVVAVPDDLAGFTADLDADRWSALVGRLRDGIVDLALPKWDIESTIDLAEPLSELGVPIPGGEFPAVGAELSKGIHAANMTVDEEGTEAAAATALGFEESGPPPVDVTIEADQPFFYAIVHEPTGALLFAGQITDPS